MGKEYLERKDVRSPERPYEDHPEAVDLLESTKASSVLINSRLSSPQRSGKLCAGLAEREEQGLRAEGGMWGQF